MSRLLVSLPRGEEGPDDRSRLVSQRAVESGDGSRLTFPPRQSVKVYSSSDLSRSRSKSRRCQRR